MSTFFKRLLIFLFINFAALAIGGFFTGDGVISDWYQNLNKAPWTPPGWVFGASWTTIMVCFAFYMAYAWDQVSNKTKLLQLFTLQWVLNVIWNPIFFYYNLVGLALFVIILLSVTVAFILFYYQNSLKTKTGFLVPYLLWMIIASSLNFFVVLYN